MLRFFIYGISVSGLLLITILALDALGIKEYSAPVGVLMSILFVLISIAILINYQKDTWINDVIIYPFSFGLGISIVLISAGMWSDWLQFGSPFIPHEYSLAGQTWSLPLILAFDAVIAIIFTAAVCISLAAIGRIFLKKWVEVTKQ